VAVLDAAGEVEEEDDVESLLLFVDNFSSLPALQSSKIWLCRNTQETIVRAGKIC